MKRLVLLLLVFAGFTVFFLRAPGHREPPDFFVSPELDPPLSDHSGPDIPVFNAQLIPRNTSAFVHAATQVELADGRIMAFWYGGSREGAKDVAIYQAIFDPIRAEWSVPVAIITTEKTQASYGGYVKKLGNVVAAVDRQGVIWLFYVSTAMGGWAASSINVTQSHDGGVHWVDSVRLQTSPLFNISYLVKGPPVELADGSMGLPVYHQAGGKFCEWIHVGRNLKVLSKSRISSGIAAIQPWVVPLSHQQAVVFMRDSGEKDRRVHMSQTHDGGKTWMALKSLQVKNPNSAVTVQRVSSDELIMVLNDHVDDRNNLTLAYSNDRGENWRSLTRFEVPEAPLPAGVNELEYSYPYLIKARNGTFHLLYSWHTKEIKHIYFNRAWLKQQL